MGSRLQLQTLLETLLGSRNVYFQPPENLKLNYPCIVYARDSGKTDFADDSPYRFSLRYSVSYIDKDPDDKIIEKLVMLPTCMYERPFKSDGLNHDLYYIYY